MKLAFMTSAKRAVQRAVAGNDDSYMSGGQIVGTIGARVRDWVRGVVRNASCGRGIAGRSPVNVHFGCGPHDDPRFVNVDKRALPHVHIVSGSFRLDRFFDRGSIDMIYASHVVEHFSFGKTHELLDHWRSMLKPGGIVRLSVPDFDKLVATYEATGRSVEAIQGYLLGGQDYPGNFHYAIFTRESLGLQLTKAGFMDIRAWSPEAISPRWPEDQSRDAAISLNLEARRPVQA